MKTKEEVIREHYLRHISEDNFNKLTIREDGIAIMYNEEGAQLSPNFMFLGFTQKYVSENIDSGIDTKTNEMVWIPKSLKGIDTNRGWNKIESKDDLPNDGYYFVMYKNGKMSDCPKNSEFEDDNYWLLNITHYQPVIKPLPPLY